MVAKYQEMTDFINKMTQDVEFLEYTIEAPYECGICKHCNRYIHGGPWKHAAELEHKKNIERARNTLEQMKQFLEVYKEKAQ